MKIIIILFLAGFVAAAPNSEKNDKTYVNVNNSNFYPKEWEVYKSDHDIVKILTPLNSINFNDNEDPKEDTNVLVFFVEADIADGKRTDKGLYILKDYTAIKLLDNGRDAAAPVDLSKLVFFGASDGLYTYNKKRNAAEKFGTITDDIISLEKEKVTDVIYILTVDKKVYKVTQNGTAKEEIEDIVNAEQIVLDYDNNLFFTSAKQAYVRTTEGVKKISGLPENPASLTLIRPPYLIKNGVPCVVNNDLYMLYPNGTSVYFRVKFDPKYKPTAISMEPTLLQYHAYDKKIYEFNLVTIVMGIDINGLDDILGDKKEIIKSLATKKKPQLYSNHHHGVPFSY